jgi:hypothetical protein
MIKSTRMGAFNVEISTKKRYLSANPAEMGFNE